MTMTVMNIIRINMMVMMTTMLFVNCDSKNKDESDNSILIIKGNTYAMNNFCSGKVDSRVSTFSQHFTLYSL